MKTDVYKKNIILFCFYIYNFTRIYTISGKKNRLFMPLTDALNVETNCGLITTEKSNRSMINFRVSAHGRT